MAYIVIAGHSECKNFALVCAAADYLSQKLPNFCFERICKTPNQWKDWLDKQNHLNKWHHRTTPLIWKELLYRGGHRYYIGNASEFWEYLHTYYGYDIFMSDQNILQNFENVKQYNETNKRDECECSHEDANDMFTICVSGASNILCTDLLSGLLYFSTPGCATVLSIYLYDETCPITFLESIEQDCKYANSESPNTIVKAINNIGDVLPECDLLIVLNRIIRRWILKEDELKLNSLLHNFAYLMILNCSLGVIHKTERFHPSIPSNPNEELNTWLFRNCDGILKLASFINISGSRKLRILFPNYGPSCFNATALSHSLIAVNRRNVVVATSDIGLEALMPTSRATNIPIRNMYCPPVWGFVGINHIVDLRSTVHKYNMFEPFKRHVNIDDTTLKIGSVTPEFRTLEYLIHWNKNLWGEIANRQGIAASYNAPMNKIKTVLDVVNLWLLKPCEDSVLSLGLLCNGSFGLTSDYIMSQPAILKQPIGWAPFPNISLPRDSYIKLEYLHDITVNIFSKLNISGNRNTESTFS